MLCLFDAFLISMFDLDIIFYSILDLFMKIIEDFL